MTAYRQFGFVRTRRTINPADPTEMVRWNLERRHGALRPRVTLTSIWETELVIELVTGWTRWLPAALRHRSFRIYRGYGTRLAAWLFGRLEDRYDAALADVEPDPMGDISDYE